MKKSIKMIVRKYSTKEGKTFVKATAKGQYLPLALVEDDVNYNIRFVGNTLMPQSEGIYEVAYEEGNLWLDTRAEVVEKNIVRVNPTKVVFSKYLPKLDKDIRG